MRILITSVSAGFLLVGALTGAQAAQAAQVDHDTYVPAPAPVPARTDVQPLDCFGTTGDMGCGPGWTWRDGWRGWACYPC